MKLQELLAQLNALAERPENLEKEVEVSVWSGLNTWPGAEIKSTFEGFDWGHNRLFIIPTEKLVIKAPDRNKLRPKSDSEGELYKNLRKMEFVFEFEARLDEAKADFPNLATWSTGYSYDDAMQKYLDAIFAWFEKWLGLQQWEIALKSQHQTEGEKCTTTK